MADTYQEQMQCSRSAERDAQTCREAVQCVRRATLMDENHMDEKRADDEAVALASRAEEAIATLELVAARFERTAAAFREGARDAPDAQPNEPGGTFGNRHADKRT
jgi:hypothetical protein